jgi:signal transduction histidine kinase
MRHAIDEVRELQTKLAAMQEDARDLVDDLRGIARALRSAPASEPAWLDELAAELASQTARPRDRQDAAWLASLGVSVSTDDAGKFVFRG